MLKHFLFAIFLTTLGLVSEVSSGGSGDESVSNGSRIQSQPYVIPTGIADVDVEVHRKEALKRSNSYRRRHELTEFILDENMNNYAQEQANVCATVSKVIRRSEIDKIYEENVYSSKSSRNLGRDAVDTWYNELRFVSENDDITQLIKKKRNIGHLINLLWKPHKEMGIGVALDNFGNYFVVANYNTTEEMVSDTKIKENLPVFKENHITDARISNSSLLTFAITDEIK